MSEGGLSALGDPGSPCCVDGWMSGADDVDGCGNLIFSDDGWSPVTETTESKTVKRGD